MHADDLTLSAKQTFHKINMETTLTKSLVTLIKESLKVNRLPLNGIKKKLIYYKRNKSLKFDVIMNNTVIAESSMFNFFGIIFRTAEVELTFSHFVYINECINNLLCQFVKHELHVLFL